MQGMYYKVGSCISEKWKNHCNASLWAFSDTDMPSSTWVMDIGLSDKVKH